MAPMTTPAETSLSLVETDLAWRIPAKRISSGGAWVNRAEGRAAEGLAFEAEEEVRLLDGCFFAYVGNMEVPFTAEQEAQLAQMATKSGTDAPHLVKDAALRLLEEEARFRAAVREGIAQADRGEFIEEEEMDARFEQMLSP